MSVKQAIETLSKAYNDDVKIPLTTVKMSDIAAAAAYIEYLSWVTSDELELQQWDGG